MPKNTNLSSKSGLLQVQLNYGLETGRRTIKREICHLAPNVLVRRNPQKLHSRVS